jgi:hypothetical protein
MGLLKKSGESAWEQRVKTLHGSSAERGMAKAGGVLRRLGEKPETAKPPGRKK